MITHRIKGALPLVVMIAALPVLLAAGPAAATPLPSKPLLSSHFGHDVNKTTDGNVCTIKEACQPGTESGEAGGFLYPQGIAVSQQTGDVYVADPSNHRVQQFAPGGEFVAMLGWEVNKTKDEANAPQAERNICTAASKDVCQAGAEGFAAGQFGAPAGIAVDPTNGDVYVAESMFGESGGEFAIGQRVQEFTSTGGFVLELGKEVNQSTKGNLCTEKEIETAAVKCTSPALRTPAAAEAGSEPAAFDFEQEHGVLAVGGPQDLLYVGEEGRVQKFQAASGAAAGEISLAALSATGKTAAIAVDPTGDVFVGDTSPEAPGVHEYSTTGQLQSQAIDSRATEVRAIALDPHGRLGILEGAITPSGYKVLGFLYSTSGSRISEFAPSGSELAGFPDGLAFAATGELYVLEETTQEVEAYTPVVFPETRMCGVEEVTATSAKLCGEINPDGVPTTGFFQYGTTPSFGSHTPAAFEGDGEAFVQVSALTALEPNEAYHYRITAEAEVNGEELQGHSEEVTFRTSAVLPQIVEQPGASFVTAQSAVLNSSLNPEHLNTLYHYEYGPCPTLAGCATAQNTTNEESSQYGVIGSVHELRDLQPLTTYSYRFIASNETEEAGKTIGGRATSGEGTFTTGALPAVQAATGLPSSVTPTSVLISGSVDPDGQPATYSFELGVYTGAGTQYGIVLSGPAAAETTPIAEVLQLTGLQPGTTYAYRITIHSGYGIAIGETVTFITQGLLAALTAPTPLPLLAIPSTAFPAVSVTKSTVKALTNAQKLANALKTCKKEKKPKRSSCEKTAHTRYGAKTKTKKAKGKQ
jgi:DNA-binding beta-propeller fold protein YncE